MPHRLSVLLLLSILAINLHAQGDSELRYFRGGKYESIISFSNALFYGIGSRVGGMGGDYGGLVQGSESLLWNPANLASIRRSQLTLDFKPRMLLDATSFVDIDAEVRSAVDESIEDSKGPNFTMSDEDYPDVGVRVGEKGSFGTGSFAFRGGGFTVAAALYQPFSLSLDLLGSGFEVQMVTIDEEDPTKDVTFFSSVDMNVHARLRIQGASIGVGKMLGPKWSVGLAVDRLSGVAKTQARFQVEGIMVVAGNERAFNDPNDPWQNNLHSSIFGKYNGNSTAFRLGTTYQLGRNWGIGAALAYYQPLKMSGSLDERQYTLEGLNLDAEDDEDLLDITEIDLDEPTRTVMENPATAKLLEIRFPNALAVGISGKAGFLGLALNYTRYFGEWSYRLDVLDDDSLEVNHKGLSMENAVRIGFDFNVLQLGAGIATGTIIDHGGDSHGKAALVPMLSLGTGFRVNQSLSADVLILGIPSGVGKVTLHYNL